MSRWFWEGVSLRRMYYGGAIEIRFSFGGFRLFYFFHVCSALFGFRVGWVAGASFGFERMLCCCCFSLHCIALHCRRTEGIIQARARAGMNKIDRWMDGFIRKQWSCGGGRVRSCEWMWPQFRFWFWLDENSLGIENCG